MASAGRSTSHLRFRTISIAASETCSRKGSSLTIEPIISERPCRVVEEADGWTLRAHNRALAAHFEETIVVTAGAPLILTRAA